jgi:argininosuccinate lyase
VFANSKKPWGGRFSEGTDPLVEDFTSSVHFDSRLYKYDIEGSIAHAEMLSRQGLITKAEAKRIVRALKEIEEEIEKGKFVPSKEFEDIHMNIEARLIQKIGNAGKKLHTARSRNDQVSLDIKLYLRSECRKILKKISLLQDEILNLAQEHINTIMPGYTHMQRAMPVLLSQHLLAYFEMLKRDWTRFFNTLKSLDSMPLGAGALAGTGLPVDRNYVAEKLGFSEISSNSMDTVSDRDFALDFLYACAVLMMHLSRLSEELILWSTQEFGFVSLPDRFATGSSMMPNKKNPDVLELIRGKTGRVYGNLISLLTVMKGLPLTYNRDMQEDKEPLFDSADTAIASINILIELLPELKFSRERMKECVDSSLFATDMAEYLVKKGVPFRTAHSIVGRIVKFCLAKKRSLDSLSLAELKKFSQKFDKDITGQLTPEASINNKSSEGGTGTQSVIDQIRKCKRILQNENKSIH